MDRPNSLDEAFRIKQPQHIKVPISQLFVDSSKFEFPDNLQQDFIEESLYKLQFNLIPVLVRPLVQPVNGKILELIFGYEWVVAARKINIKELRASVLETSDEVTHDITHGFRNILNSYSVNHDSVFILIQTLQNQLNEFQSKTEMKFNEVLEIIKPKEYININTLTLTQFKKLKAKGFFDGLGDVGFKKILKARDKSSFVGIDDIENRLLSLKEKSTDVTKILNILRKHDLEF